VNLKRTKELKAFYHLVTNTTNNRTNNHMSYLRVVCTKLDIYYHFIA